MDIVSKILKSAQENVSYHEKGVQLLRNHYKDNEGDIPEFLETLLHRIVISKPDVANFYLENLIAFLAHFCQSYQKNADKLPEQNSKNECHPIVNSFCQYALKGQKNAIESIRFWSCRMLWQLLEYSDTIDHNTYKEITTAMLDRINDPKSLIRLEAIRCLSELQDVYCPDDPVIEKLICIMKCDRNSKVRELCVKEVCMRTHDVLPAIIQRTRDVNEQCRYIAFKRLIESPKRLSIEQRRLIISTGLSDDSNVIKQYVRTILLSEWLKCYQNNIFGLLSAFRYDASAEDIISTEQMDEKVLNCIFRTMDIDPLLEKLNLNNNKIIDMKTISSEISIYWRCLLQYLSDNDELYIKYVPSLIDFCKILSDYCENSKMETASNVHFEYQFIIRQLCLMINIFDLSDAHGRQLVLDTSQNILRNSNIISIVIEAIIKILQSVFLNEDHLCQFVSEIYSDIMYPIKHEKSVDDFNVRLDCLRNEKYRIQNEKKNAISEQNFLEADLHKNHLLDIDEQLHALEQKISKFFNQDEPLLRTQNVNDICKSLDILIALLKSGKITRLNFTLKEVLNNDVMELLMDGNDDTMQKVFHFYALCCVIDLETAKRGIHVISKPLLLYKIGEEYDLELLKISASAVVDLLIIYGVRIMNENNEDMNTNTIEKPLMLLQSLANLMDDERTELQEIAAKGLSLLLRNQRIRSSALLPRLIVKWSNPITANTLIRLLIGSTLTDLHLIQESPDYIEDAVLLTLKTIALAPSESPLTQINVERTLKFLICLCQSFKTAQNIQDTLAVKICNDMLNGKNNSNNLYKLYVKTLVFLQPPQDELVKKDITTLCSLIIQQAPASIVKSITKYLKILNNTMKNEEKYLSNNTTINEANESQQ